MKLWLQFRVLGHLLLCLPIYNLRKKLAVSRRSPGLCTYPACWGASSLMVSNNCSSSLNLHVLDLLSSDWQLPVLLSLPNLLIGAAMERRGWVLLVTKRSWESSDETVTRHQEEHYNLSRQFHLDGQVIIWHVERFRQAAGWHVTATEVWELVQQGRLHSP